MRRGVIESYRSFLPDFGPEVPVVTLLEGDTPLIPVPRLAKWLGLPDGAKLSLKYEGLNPTGSFKDRGMTAAVSIAKGRGANLVMCASTGNTSAAAAAYAARAGMGCIVLLPRGEVALGKLSQALLHGAKVLAVDGNFDAALCLVREITSTHPIELVNSVNPVRIEGQKTASFEIIDVLGDAPDFHALPVGNAGNIMAYWRGFKEYHAAGKSTKLPKMLGFQAEGAAPLVKGLPVEEPHTVATAIRIGNPASWQGAIAARDESGGLIDCVTDTEILEAYQAVAATEGIFVEPASATSLAGLSQLVARGYFAAYEAPMITATLTGLGLKDPDRAIKVSGGNVVEIPATRDAILREIDSLLT
jgi:threonine synthase